MNAYELANELQKFATGKANDIHWRGVLMLRQQADRIAELEKDLEGCEYFLKTNPIEQSNNEPTAWIDYLQHSDVYDLNVSGRGIPLYTRPSKQLSSKGLDKLVKDAQQGGYMDLYIDGLIDGFNHAKAIIEEIKE